MGRLVRRPRRLPGLDGYAADHSGDRRRGSQRRAGLGCRAAAGSGRQRDRRLDGVGRTHDARSLSPARPRRARASAARRITKKEATMFYILAWLLGVPLSVILLLFLFGIGR
ncbi:MAG: hypothetical protein EHM88_11730 [Candidatus Rokuibacteriota bacterium]|nr:MAG: hypothetical protein EHM88_11730 [Candidatus Rokubacteria bacterium]